MIQNNMLIYIVNLTESINLIPIAWVSLDQGNSLFDRGFVFRCNNHIGRHSSKFTCALNKKNYPFLVRSFIFVLQYETPALKLLESGGPRKLHLPRLLSRSPLAWLQQDARQ